MLAGKPFRYLPMALAFLDVAVISAYALELEVLHVQVAIFALKAALFPFALSHGSIITQVKNIYISFLVLCLITIAFSPVHTTEATAQLIAFFGNILFTLSMKVQDRDTYVKYIAVFCTFWFVLFIAMVTLGLVPDIYGRYQFFTIHYNVGSEIAAISIICAAITMNLRPYIACLVPATISVLLMQGRAGILVISAVTAIKLAIFLYKEFNNRRRRWLLFLLVPVFGVSAALATPFIIDALMLDNEYRGVGTGFAGRTERWGPALARFYENPFGGIGVGSSTALELETPHNFFLYGLSEMGIFFFGVLLILAVLFWRSTKSIGIKMLLTLPLTLLMFFNDRFINLNPYPFVMYVLLFIYAARPMGYVQTATGAGAPRYARMPRAGRAGAASAYLPPNETHGSAG